MNRLDFAALAAMFIAEYGVSYDEYKEVAEKVKSLGHGVEWPVSKDTFDLLVEESRRRILER